MKKSYFVYIASNVANKVLYIGVTNNLLKRLSEHKNKVVSSFSSKYNVNKLLYYEMFEDITLAIKREKQLKEWKRHWKEELIMSLNPDFDDLSESLRY